MKNLRIVQMFVISFLCFFLISNNLHSQKEDQKTPPLKEGMARIIFTRHGNMMGAAVVHFVVDRSDSLNFNACVFQKTSFPAEKSNFDKAGNVKSLYVKLNKEESKLTFGKKQKSDKPVNHPFDVKSYPELATIPGPTKVLWGRRGSFMPIILRRNN